MEHLTPLLDTLPEAAKDIRLGLKSTLSEEGSPGLTTPQIWGAALSAALTTKNHKLVDALSADSAEILGPQGLLAAQTAAAIMGMTNIYYHTTFHLMKEQTYRTMPAGLRMNGVKTHGYDPTSYEVFALAASIIGQCGNCINAHEKHLRDAGLTQQAIHSIVRLASYINGAGLMLR